jgi:hypothetical protein
VRTTGATLSVAATDAETGLRYEVETSTTFHDSGARVSTTKDTPDRVRRDLEGEQVALRCTLRGSAKTQGFPGAWHDVDKPFGTALLVDGDANAARLVKSCLLMRGEPGPRPGTTSYSTDPADAYSRVRFR